MKIILVGSNGKMGHKLESIAKEKGIEIVAKVDVTNENGYTDISCVKEDADCVVDFSHHSATEKICEFVKRTHTPAIFAATGQTEEEKEMILAAAKYAPVFFSANMSVGVALLVELAKTAAKAMPDADIEIVEAHHNRKLDAPSGTALMLAEALKKVRENAKFVLGRSGHAKREKDEIGISSIRMGNVVGMHEVLICTDAQTLTIKHEAHDRALFAEGAISAAEFLIKQPVGLYAMQDMLKEK